MRYKKNIKTSTRRTHQFITYFSYKKQLNIHMFSFVFLIIFSFPSSNISAEALKKTIHTYFVAAETGFDPVATSDLYSSIVDMSIYETLYSYDYLASPVKLIPSTATALPEISSDGLTYTIHIKKGIYFSEDPIFKGTKRELTSYDYAYSLKRLLDPQLRSPNSWLIENSFKGMQVLIEQAKKSGKFNYDAPVEGIQTPDRYTLRLKLNEIDYNLTMKLTHTPTAALAREVVEKYRNPQGFVMNHPIGTGAFILAKWVPGSRILLKRNPSYRGYIWNFEGGNKPEDQKIVAKMRGKKMPQIDEVDIQIIEEKQTQWLAFKQKQLDWITLSEEIASTVIKNNQLIPEVAKTGVYLSQSIPPSLPFTYWNLQDPVVGGLSSEKVALRRAIAMAFSTDKFIQIVANGNGIATAFPVPPNIVGYNSEFKTSIPYSVAAANLLLDRYGYKKNQDGYRQLPNGEALTIEYTMTSGSSSSFKIAEFWKRTFDQIGIHFQTKSMQFPDYLKAQKQCSIQMGMQSWIADYPDADNFFQLFYGKNIHGSNFGCIKIPEYDALYEQTRLLPAGSQRDFLYQKMARILEVYKPISVNFISNDKTLVQPYVLGYKAHPILNTPWLYIDLEN